MLLIKHNVILAIAVFNYVNNKIIYNFSICSADCCIYPLNLSLQTLNGIISHNGEFECKEYVPKTMESFAQLDEEIENCCLDIVAKCNCFYQVKIQPKNRADIPCNMRNKLNVNGTVKKLSKDLQERIEYDRENNINLGLAFNEKNIVRRDSSLVFGISVFIFICRLNLVSKKFIGINNLSIKICQIIFMQCNWVGFLV